jgi:hypothetical protein
MPQQKGNQKTIRQSRSGKNGARIFGLYKGGIPRLIGLWKIFFAA